MDTLIERILFFSRWLLAPMYLGLAGALAFLVFKFLAEFIHVVSGIVEFSECKVVLSVLSLIDITLVANLLLMVILSGYENFVSRIDVAVGRQRPNWLGHLDFSGLKLKLIGSIAAVAAIDLLGAFMNVDQFTSEQLAWKVGIQMSFVVAGVLYALMERIAARTRHIEEEGGSGRHMDH
jgi:uncharacterized protein (TIGR00645 family)